MKRISCAILLLIVSLFMIQGVNAFDSQITMTEELGYLYMDEDLNVYNYEISDFVSRFYHKNSTGGQVTCISGLSHKRPEVGRTCDLVTNWSNDNKYGIGYIHHLLYNASGAAYEKYWWDNYLTLYYLGTLEDRFFRESISNKVILNTGKTFSQIITEARAYAANIPTSSITANGSKNTSVTFTLNDDGYYYSNEVTIVANDDYSMGPINNTKFSYTKNGDKYIFKIKASDIASNTTERLEVLFLTYKSMYEAAKYDCHGLDDNIQDVTTFNYNTKTVSQDSATVIGSVAKTSGRLTIVKTNSDNTPLAGAEIEITGPNDYSYTFVTTTSPTVIDNLEFGTYTIKETKAPDGYIKASAEGITLSTSNASPTVQVIDELTVVRISKTDFTGRNELRGATLKITDSSNNNIACTIERIQNGVTTLESLDDCTWVSGDTAVSVVGLKAGNYYLEETQAPNGYVKNVEKVSFTIKDDGTSNPVKMTNALTKVKISKINAVNSRELEGAHLQIEDALGNIVNYCKDSNNNPNSECKWISGTEPYIIEGMPNGTYYFVETLAPEGYILNTEKVEFIVDGNNAIVEVQMINELEVDVPDTLSAKSALLLAIAMFDIALGIGILVYVKKNKED